MSGLRTKNLLLVLLSSGSSEPHKLLTSKEHWVSSPPPDTIAAAPATCPFSSYLLPQGLNCFSEFRRFWKAASHLFWIDGKGGRMIDSSTEDACGGKAFDLSVWVFLSYLHFQHCCEDQMLQGQCPPSRNTSAMKAETDNEGDDGRFSNYSSHLLSYKCLAFGRWGSQRGNWAVGAQEADTLIKPDIHHCLP